MSNEQAEPGSAAERADASAGDDAVLIEEELIIEEISIDGMCGVY
jgi:mycofactocin precursor